MRKDARKAFETQFQVPVYNAKVQHISNPARLKPGEQTEHCQIIPESVTRRAEKFANALYAMITMAKCKKCQNLLARNGANNANVVNIVLGKA